MPSATSVDSYRRLLLREGVGELGQSQLVLRPHGWRPEAGSSSYLGLKNT